MLKRDGVILARVKDRLGVERYRVVYDKSGKTTGYTVLKYTTDYSQVSGFKASWRHLAYFPEYADAVKYIGAGL